MTVGVPQAPWEYSLRWAAWLARSQIEKGWLEVHLDIKKRGKLSPPGGQRCSLTLSRVTPPPQKNPLQRNECIFCPESGHSVSIKHSFLFEVEPGKSYGDQTPF